MLQMREPDMYRFAILEPLCLHYHGLMKISSRRTIVSVESQTVDHEPTGRVFRKQGERSGLRELSYRASRVVQDGLLVGGVFGKGQYMPGVKDFTVRSGDIEWLNLVFYHSFRTEDTSLLPITD